MSTHTLSNRDAKAIAVIESVLRAGLATRSPISIHVTPQDNHSGEPAFYVYVVVPTAQDIPTEPELNRLIVETIEALETIDETRFPYLNVGSGNLDEGGWKRAGRVDEKA